MELVLEPAKVRLFRVSRLLRHDQVREGHTLLPEFLSKRLSHDTEKVVAVIKSFVKQKVEPLTNEWQSAQRPGVHHLMEINARLHNLAHFGR